jgi:hypothetical protein
MEQVDEEAEAQESSCGSAWQARRARAQRGQTPRQPNKWPQGWPGQKPQKTNCRPSQCTPAAARPQTIIDVIALIRARYGATMIGLGHQGLRFAGVQHAHTA